MADTSPTGHRNLIIAIAGAVLAVMAILLVVGLTRGGDTDETTVTTTATSIEVPDFVVLVPPAELRVEAIAGDTYRLSWEAPQPDVTFQLHLVGTTEDVIVDASPYDWVLADASVTPCFEIRSVGDDGRRLSQSATGPVCAAG